MSSSYSLLFIYENAKQNRLTDHKLVWSIMLTAHGCVIIRKEKSMSHEDSLIDKFFDKLNEMPFRLV